jgi:hypothetical protein
LTCGSYLAAIVGGPLPLCQGANGDNCKVASSMLQVMMPSLIWGSPSAYADRGPETSSIKIGDIIPAKLQLKRISNVS